MRKALLFLAFLGAASLAEAQNGVTLPAGSNTLKSLNFAGYPGLGIYSPSAGVMYLGDENGGIACTVGSGCTTWGTFTSSSGVFMQSTLATNGVDAANAVWGVSNGLRFEGATANGNETTITPTDPTGTRTITLPNASGTVALSGAINRSDLVEDALQSYGISIQRLQQITGIPLSASETGGNFNVSVATNVIVAKGEVTDIETEVSVVLFQFVLPPSYVSTGDVTVRLPCALISSGSPTNNGSTIDVAVYEQTNNAVGSDLSTTTAAATFAALDTWYNKDFVITATGLVAGDVVNVVVTATVIDSEAGAGTIILNLAPPSVLLDIKG